MEDGDETETADENVEEDTEEEEQQRQQGTSYRHSPKDESKKKCCTSQRIDELSTPPKRIFLALWNQHAYHLPKDKVKNLKQLLQQLYAMSPEETAKYFAELRAEAKAAAMRKKLKQKLRKYLMDKHHQKQRARAYKLFKRLLKCGISYAAQNPVPPLVSIRLRYLSDIILEQLCDLKKVEVPSRTNTDKLGNFLISVADWMAIAVERLYYAAQLSTNEMTDQEYARNETMEVPKTYQEFVPAANSTPQKHPDHSIKVPKTFQQFAPAASSTPRHSMDQTMKVPKRFEDMSQPAASSTPKKLSLNPSVDEPADTMKRLSLSPFYSYVEPGTVISPPTTKIIQNKTPYYSFKHMKVPPGTVLDKSYMEVPPAYCCRKKPTSNSTIPSTKDLSRSVSGRSRKSKKKPSRKNSSKCCPNSSYRRP